MRFLCEIRSRFRMGFVRLFVIIIIGFIQVSVSRPPRYDEDSNSELEEGQYGVDKSADYSMHSDDTPSNDEEKREYNLEQTPQDETLQIPDTNVNVKNQQRNLIYESDKERKVEVEFSGEPSDKSSLVKTNDAVNLNEFESSSVISPSDEYTEKNIANEPLSLSDNNLYGNFNDEENNKNLLFSLKRRESSTKAKTNRVFRNQKEYYKKYHQNEKPVLLDRNYEKPHRDRRQLIEVKQSEQNDKHDSTANEDEESAIRRHIRKLSSMELEKLLNSLTEDKRELLKSIMSSDSDTKSDNVNKREITKKAGAAEDNNYLLSGHADISKFQSGGSTDSADSSNSQVTYKTETSKQADTLSETTSLSTLKNTNLDNVSGTNLAKSIDLTRGVSEKQPEVPSEATSKYQSENAKNENKREINEEDLININNQNEENELNFDVSQDTSNENDNFYSQNNYLSEINESHMQRDDSNINKREIVSETTQDIGNSIKSLEESFPNSDAYEKDGEYSEFNLEPLIRVKRKNLNAGLEKRAASLSDMKVGFFPNVAENDDMENDEGGEFSDDGVQQNSANFAKKGKPSFYDIPLNNRDFQYIDSERRRMLRSTNGDGANRNLQNSEKNDGIVSNTVNLGSDTDSVLTGIEGVDDNLMLNSGVRNKRNADNNDAFSKDILFERSRQQRSTPLIDDEMKTASANFITVHSYDETDSFGPLLKDYNGEFGRYKRIRQAKRPDNSVETISSNA